jgi:hypothetical protein
VQSNVILALLAASGSQRFGVDPLMLARIPRTASCGYCRSNVGAVHLKAALSVYSSSCEAATCTLQPGIEVKMARLKLADSLYVDVATLCWQKRTVLGNAKARKGACSLELYLTPADEKLQATRLVSQVATALRVYAARVTDGFCNGSTGMVVLYRMTDTQIKGNAI